MARVFLKISLFLFLPCLTLCQLDEGIIFNYNNTYKYNVPYMVYVNKSIEYIMEFAGDPVSDTPARVTVASDIANSTYPLFITARQQKGVFSWQLPQLVQTSSGIEQFTNISRTLCPHNNLFAEDDDTCDISNLNTPIIHLTSSSPDSIMVTILVETVEDFYIKMNHVTNLTTSPSQPKYYFYPFKQDPQNAVDLHMQRLQQESMCDRPIREADKGRLEKYVLERRVEYTWLSRPKSVILMIESDDDICALISIQNFSCPVFDNQRDVLYDGYYLTMTRSGGITLTQDQFPLGFYIVFIVLTSDDDCGVTSSNETVPSVAKYFWGEKGELEIDTGNRVKNFSFRIVPTISYLEYAIAAGAALGFFLAFYLAFIIVVLVQLRWKGETVSVASSSEVDEESPAGPSAASAASGDLDTPRHEDDSSSDTDSEICTVGEGDDGDRLVAKLCVANLARSRLRVLSSRSRLYLWNVLTVAVFYTLPVIQLVVTYQRLLNQSGNQDLCYFNFFCAHPLMMLSDFNHVYSNLGYVLLGILFLIQVWRRHKIQKHQNSEMGIPTHWGLFYAMGVGLMSEGLLSAAYHVCPNSMNFQFDTSFMYVTSVVCMVKLYQARHPDINARAHFTFGVLALIIFVGLVGVLYPNLLFWIVFTILHIVTCLFMTFQIYYLGKFKLDAGVFIRAGRELVSRPLAAVTPARCGRCVLLVIANLTNWAIAAYGVAQHSKDFASHLLLVLMSNLFLYTLFYIVMKLLHRESIRWYSWVFIALTYSVWFSSSYFYLDQSTNWALSPAQSRRNNRACSLLQLYDSHDLWHFMSAIAMFFSFNMYLTIDDNLAQVSRTEIAVF